MNGALSTRLPASGIARIQARRDGWRLGNSADRARLYGGGESADHPGLVCLPGSQSVFSSPAQPLCPGWDTRGGALSPKFGRRRTFIQPLTKRDQLGGDLLRDGAQRLPGVGLLHPHKMEKTNVPVVAPAYANERE